MTQQELYIKYPKIFDLSFTHRVNWGIPETWVSLVDSLCAELQELYDKGLIEQNKCVQIKEKFGSLRCYLNTESEIERSVISKYEKQSTELCQECGCADCDLYRTKGWIRYVCKPCAVKLDKEVYEN